MMLALGRISWAAVTLVLDGDGSDVDEPGVVRRFTTALGDLLQVVGPQTRMLDIRVNRSIAELPRACWPPNVRFAALRSLALRGVNWECGVPALSFAPALRRLTVGDNPMLYSTMGEADIVKGVERLHLHSLANYDTRLQQLAGLRQLEVVVRDHVGADALMHLPRASEVVTVRLGGQFPIAVAAGVLLLAMQPRNCPEPPKTLKFAAEVPWDVESASVVGPLQDLCDARGIWLDFIALQPS